MSAEELTLADLYAKHVIPLTHRKIQSYVHHLWIAGAVERIENSQDETAVCEEWRLRTDSDLVSLAALDQLRAFIGSFPKDQYRERQTKIDSIINAGGVELVFQSLIEYEHCKQIQISGFRLLLWFVTSNNYMGHSVSSRADIVQLIFHNIERFPDDLQCQRAMWDSIPVIQQANVRGRRLYPHGNTTFSVNLLSANALNLCYNVLELQQEDYESIIVHGALWVIETVSSEAHKNLSIAAAYRSFLRSHPRLEEILDQYIERSFALDDFAVHSEASILKMDLVLGL